MGDINKLLVDAEKINALQIQSDAIIDNNKADIKADFAQFDGISLDSPQTTLQIDYASFDGSNNNAIDIAVDGSGTWTTVSAHADNSSKQLYYKVMQKELPIDGGADVHTITGSNAYAIIKGLGIHKIMT